MRRSLCFCISSSKRKDERRIQQPALLTFTYASEPALFYRATSYEALYLGLPP